MNAAVELEVESPEQTLRDYIDMLRRRWLPAVLVGCAILAAAFLTAFLWPATYRSTATILIEQQEIPQDLVRSTITTFADQRVEQISARVMTTTNLLAIVREQGLYADDFDSQPREVIIERMRGDISRQMITADVIDPRSGRPTEATIAFTVGFDSRSPALAARIANELTNLFLEENLATRRGQAADTTAFLIDEAARVRQEIAALEAEVAEFEQANVNALPELAAINIQFFNRTELDLAEVRRSRDLVEERRIYLESELAQLSPYRDNAGGDGSIVLSPQDQLRSLYARRASMLGLYGDAYPPLRQVESAIAALEAEFGADDGSEAAALRERLAVARAERNRLAAATSSVDPEVVRYDLQIEALEQEIAAAGSVAAAASDARSDREADNPAYVQLRAQLTAAESEIASLVEKESGLADRLVELERRVAEAPIVERDYFALTRDLENLRANYNEIRSNARAAETAESLEMGDKGEQFILLEPALVPQQPVSPNRSMIAMLGIMGSLGAAVAVIAVLEALDTSVRGPAELRALTSLLPLGVIPKILTSADRRLQRRRRIQYACAGIVGVIVLVGLVHFLYMPVDDLWLRALRRLGA